MNLSSCLENIREVFNCPTPLKMSCQANGTEGAIRLVSRSANNQRPVNNRQEGFLEIFHDGIWGTICANSFSYTSARVACRQLGFDNEQVDYFTLDNNIGYRNTPIHLDEVMCRGGESGLHLCKANLFGMNNCLHVQDIVLKCGGNSQPDSANQYRKNVRLTGSLVNGTGFVETFDDVNQWQRFCINSFSPENAAVACHQLGFGYSNSIALPTNNFSFLTTNQTNRSGYFRNCLGNEIALRNCPTVSNSETCSENQNMAISCVGTSISELTGTEALLLAIAGNDDIAVENQLNLGNVSANAIYKACCGEKFPSGDGLRNISALICAACYGSHGSAKALLKHGANIEFSSNLERKTALYWAVYFGHTNVVEVLVKAGANVDVPGLWILGMAVVKGFKAIVKILVEGGAELYDVETIANRGGHSEVISYFMARKDGSEERFQLFQAITNGDLPMVHSLLRFGVDPNLIIDSCCSFSTTPALFCATCNQQIEIVRLLVSKRANVNSKVAGNETNSLIWAASVGNFQITRILIENGADVNAFTKGTGDTPLIVAASNGHFVIVKYLVQHGANLSHRNFYAATVASQNGHNEIYTFLRSNE